MCSVNVDVLFSKASGPSVI